MYFLFKKYKKIIIFLFPKKIKKKKIVTKYNLTVEFYVLYIFKTHVKFPANLMLFTIQPIDLFLCIILDYKNLKFKYLIDDLTINL